MVGTCPDFTELRKVERLMADNKVSIAVNRTPNETLEV